MGTTKRQAHPADASDSDALRSTRALESHEGLFTSSAFLSVNPIDSTPSPATGALQYNCSAEASNRRSRMTMGRQAQREPSMCILLTRTDRTACPRNNLFRGMLGRLATQSHSWRYFGTCSTCCASVTERSESLRISIGKWVSQLGRKLGYPASGVQRYECRQRSTQFRDRELGPGRTMCCVSRRPEEDQDRDRGSESGTLDATPHTFGSAAKQRYFLIHSARRSELR